MSFSCCLPSLNRMQIVEDCSPYARIVVTGSGLVALLNAIRTARVNGYALFDAVSYTSLGSEPSRLVSEAMAAGILPSYSSSWPLAMQTAITPSAIVAELAHPAHQGLTSARPALIAYTIGRMGDAQQGTAAEVMAAAVGAALGKLEAESTRDTVVALSSLTGKERKVLRAVACGGYTWQELEDIRARRVKEFKEGAISAQPELLAKLIIGLSEDGSGSSPVRLQPPYECLLQSWITTGGQLAVAVEDDEIDLAHDVRKHLVSIAQTAQRKIVEGDPALQAAVSTAVLAALARNCIGAEQPSGKVVPPTTAAEFNTIPALQGLCDMLSAEYVAGIGRQPTLSKFLQGAGSAGAIPFQHAIGWQTLLAFRHFEAHIWAKPSQLVRNGLTAAVVTDVVSKAVAVLTSGPDPRFVIADGLLKPVMKRGAGSTPGVRKP